MRIFPCTYENDDFDHLPQLKLNTGLDGSTQVIYYIGIIFSDWEINMRQ